MGVPGNANALLLKSAAGGGAYQIQRSIRLNSADSAYLSRTPGSAGNRKTWTWAGWVKRSKLGTRQSFFGAGTTVASAASLFYVAFWDGDVIRFSSGTAQLGITTAVFRDVSAWYHIVIAVDTTQATADNRIKLYVNGSQVAFTVSSLAQNDDTAVNNTVEHGLGRLPLPGDPFYCDLMLAETYLIDGQALDPSSFTETNATTGQLIPKAYTGSYGTNGFKLNFSDNSTAAALGTDTSGNGHTWTVNNLSVTAGSGNDSLVDTPTSYGTDTGVGGEVRGNYCTLNPLNLKANGSLANGNLDWSASAAYGHAVGTVGVSSGKWYCEFTVSAIASGIGVGVTSPQTAAQFLEGDALGIGYYSTNGNVYYSGGNGAYGTTFTTNDVIGVALDLDNGKVFFSKNGTWQNSGNPATGTNPARTGLSGTYTFGVNVITGTGSGVFNFGQRAFAYTAPSGFKALCDTNLPTPVVAKPNTVMDVKLYTGNGSSQTISGLGFSPDLVWTKSRSASDRHNVFDILRSGLRLRTDGTEAEDSTTVALTSNGFSLGSQSENNSNGQSYVGWAWDAGTSTVTNTSGSISAQVRANASAGFSVVTWTGNGTNGATVGHGLGVAPGMVIVKSRSAAYEWPVYHSGLTAGNNLFLHLTNAQNSVSSTITAGGVGAVSSTTFTCTQGIGNINNTNASSATYVAYCFAPVAGYSSFGSYVGNGSSDGPMVWTGFRPRWVMIKASSASGSHWLLIDSTRSNYNQTFNQLYANLANAEDANNSALDLLSNGFKCRADTFSNINGSGITYIYYAVAESPFQYARAR